MNKKLRCSRCGNEDEKYFYKDGDIKYCRRCIHFGRINVGEKVHQLHYGKKKHNCDYHLKYPLTKAQKQAQIDITYHLSRNNDVLVYAACGARKD